MEDFAYCESGERCTGGYQREFRGVMTLDNVEMRYFGQNGRHYGIEVADLGDHGALVNISNVAMNRGYYGALNVRKSNHVSLKDSVIFRTLLPAVRIHSGHRNMIIDNLAVVGIFSGTHRDAYQGAEIAEIKLRPMMGMYHDQAFATVMVRNVAAGSERAGKWHVRHERLVL